MKRVHLILLFNLVLLVVMAQDNFIRISGRVTDSETPELRIYGMRVRLHFGDSLLYLTYCDSSGHYHFDVPFNLSKYGSVKIDLRQDNTKMWLDSPKIKECSEFKNPNMYFNNDVRILRLSDLKRDYRVDFSIEKAIVDRNLPCVSFEKNSTKFKKCSGDSTDRVIGYLKCFLSENPTTVIGIYGKSWDERFQRRLCRKRARSIKTSLISSGVDRARIKTGALRDREPVFSRHTIEAEKDVHRKAEMQDVNRSVYFVILSFDYEPGLKKIADDW